LYSGDNKNRYGIEALLEINKAGLAARIISLEEKLKVKEE
jgi:hypothetical protein